MRLREIWEYISTSPENTNYSIFKEMVDSYVARGDNSLYDYTIDADILDSVDLLGKKASDLQEGVFFDDGKVYGKLKWVSNYTGFSGNPNEQNGYYLVLHYECDDATSIKVNGYVVDPEDGLLILYMRKFGGKAKIEVIDSEGSITDWIDFSGLEFE